MSGRLLHAGRIERIRNIRNHPVAVPHSDPPASQAAWRMSQSAKCAASETRRKPVSPPACSATPEPMGQSHV
ncbi:hypothetical protein Salmuc_04481 [Salipiger mucosus DSM 16094]|uniref:Uncharacterized protein n=1 Tax=Salipiger mucosus DSM 16094 TaxID=1123237 RepID=S9RVY2_9RHOB|nr:hypothetical protein Salmuc_04481 [Salipiger mucosus DSM 16094]